jgi:hypothetical protein
MIKVMVLILTTWNTSNGDKLYEATRVFDGFAVTGNRIEECRRFGVREAHKLSEKYNAEGFSASTNVDCHWEQRPGAPA